MIENIEVEITSDILSKYLELMTEIRKREEVILGLHDGSCNAKYLIVNYEVMFFQLRKILEIIAKSPMLINESEYRSISQRPENDWRIRDIMDKLERINPNFYPNPINIIKKDGMPDEFINKTTGFLTRDELCDAYNHCNSFLHSLNPLKKGCSVDFKYEWNYITSILGKIHGLLNPHLSKPISNGSFYYIGMENGQGSPYGNVFGKLE